MDNNSKQNLLPGNTNCNYQTTEEMIAQTTCITIDNQKQYCNEDLQDTSDALLTPTNSYNIESIPSPNSYTSRTLTYHSSNQSITDDFFNTDDGEWMSLGNNNINHEKLTM
jgi:hypothetical protein